MSDELAMERHIEDQDETITELREQLAAQTKRADAHIQRLEDRLLEVSNERDQWKKRAEDAERERDALKYEPNGQVRANLSNDAIQSILDKAKEYADERDALKKFLRDDLLKKLYDYESKCLSSARFQEPLAEALDARLMIDAILAALAEPAQEKTK